MGSFEAWDRLVRAVVVWLGLEDPCAGQRRISEVDDEDKAQLRAFLTAARDAFGERAWTVSELIAKAGERTEIGRELRNPALHEATMALDRRSDGERLHPTRIGNALRSANGRVVGGLKLVRGDTIRSAIAWSVTGGGL